MPLFIYLYTQGDIVFCLILFSFAVASDFFDGYFARRLKATSKFGSYYDAATDFTLIIGIYGFFFTRGFYPSWLPLLIIFSFAQFIVISHYAKKLYDPIGRYVGSALYIGIILTLVFPAQPTYDFVQYAFIGFLVVSLGSRITSLIKKHG